MAERPAVDRPVFVMGTGRCGLTPLLDAVAFHPEFGWPSQYNMVLPGKPWVSKASRLADYPPFTSRRLKFSKFTPRHWEAYEFWNHLFHGFATPYRDLAAEDVTELVRQKFHSAISDILWHQRKPRFIAEYAGWSRVRFLREIFPDAQFIHLVRDGRAVANSLTHVDWWTGWQGIFKWHFGPLTGDDLEDFEQSGESFLALAAIHWRLLIRNILENTESLPPEDHLLVRYEDMVADPPSVARQCIAFCGLDPDDHRFRAHLNTLQVVDANATTFRIPSWRSNLTARQVELLDSLLAPELQRFDYPIG